VDWDEVEKKVISDYEKVVADQQPKNLKVMYSVPMPIPAGALFTITSGAYSDYSIDGVFRALVEIDLHDLLIRWFEDHPDQQEKYSFEREAFLASICMMMEQVDCYEMHLGDYSSMGTAYVGKVAKGFEEVDD
jgi:hypothetical protein